jgi:iduronate 2-sulfatase
MYNGTVATPSWFAFPNRDEEMTETMLAQHTVDTIANISASSQLTPFFLAVGFHKPHVPWYFPEHYLQYYPNDTISLPPHPFKPVNAPNIAMQSVLRGWST